MAHILPSTLQHAFLILLLVLAGWLLAHTPVRSQSTEHAPARSTLSLELDPAPFLLNGYSFSLRYASARLPHWSATASVFAADFPDGMLSEENEEADWTGLQFNRSHALFVDYSFREDGRGFFCGPSVFLYDNSVQHAPSGTTQAFRSIYPNVRVGYTWFPFRRAGFYLSPWVNMGTEVALDAPDASDGPKYEVAGFKYVAAVHLGYRHTFR